AFLERLEAAALDGGEVHEEILAAVGRGDETEALGVVEPLHGTCTHFAFLACDGKNSSSRTAGTSGGNYLMSTARAPNGPATSRPENQPGHYTPPGQAPRRR